MQLYLCAMSASSHCLIVLNTNQIFIFPAGFIKVALFPFNYLLSIGFVFCTMVMMKQLNYLLNSKELGLEKHNVGAIASGYGFEGVPFKEILKQMPDVTECLCGFYTPIPKSSFSSYELREWEGQTDKEQRIKLENETINQDYVDFFR